MDTQAPNKNISYIIGLGNPIIDISGEIDTETLQKYNLGWGKTVFADDSNMGFYETLEAQKGISYIPGGSVTNSIRIASVSFMIISVVT